MLLAYIPKRATHINHSHIEQVNEEKERSLHDQTEVECTTKLPDSQIGNPSKLQVWSDSIIIVYNYDFAEFDQVFRACS